MIAYYNREFNVKSIKKYVNLVNILKEKPYDIS